MTERLTDEQVNQVVDELIRRLGAFNDYPFAFQSGTACILRSDIFDAIIKALKRGRASPSPGTVRPCTCHPDDNPPVPCPRMYALHDCRRAAAKSGVSHGD